MINPTYSAFITIVNDNSYYLPITMRTYRAHNAENQETAGHLEQEKMTDPIEDQRQSFNNWLDRTGQSTLAVAKRAGINESALRHYKNGKTRDLRMENKLKIAQTQHAKLSDIFGETAQRFSSTANVWRGGSRGRQGAKRAGNLHNFSDCLCRGTAEHDTVRQCLCRKGCQHT
jgi:DNA-binding XRE family transcriptional regulator